ncbi:MAG: hypothetical protein MJZ29_09315, partial [Bacteroidaceae bacterium]|nr:hypothetical protein [Bacteroidaceae bacterium]
MKHSSIIIFLALALSFVASCHWNPYDEKLAEIDSLTLSNPDSAIGLLSNIDVADFSSDANRFYYDLLCLKAVAKAHYTIPSDSGVVDMVSYFESHDERKLAEAYYYAAKAYQGMNDAPQAIAYFQKVLDQPLDSTNKLLSNALYHSGVIFRQQFLREASVDMFERSYRCDSIRKDTAAMIENLQYIASALGMNHYTPELMDSVVIFYNKAKILASQSNNLFKKVNCYIYLSSAYISIGHLALGEEFLDSAELCIKSIEKYDDMDFYNTVKAQLAFEKKDYAEAESVCLGLLQSDDVDQRQLALYYLTMIAAANRNAEDIDRYFPRYKEVTDSIDLIKASEATANVNALYNYQLRERENLRLQAESQSRLYAIIVLIAVTIALALAFFVYRLRREKERNIAQAQIARLKQFEKLQNQQEDNTDADTQSINSQIAVLEQEKQKVNRTKLIASESYKVLQKKLSEGKTLRPSDMKALDETVNAIIAGFKETLFCTYNLSQQEYHICLLLKFDVSATEISQLLGRSVGAISLARKRLFVKLFGKEGSAAELDDYIRSL